LVISKGALVYLIIKQEAKMAQNIPINVLVNSMVLRIQ